MAGVVERVGSHKHPNRAFEPEGQPARLIHDVAQQAEEVESCGHDQVFGSGMCACWRGLVMNLVGVLPIYIPYHRCDAAAREGLEV